MVFFFFLPLLSHDAPTQMSQNNKMLLPEGCGYILSVMEHSWTATSRVKKLGLDACFGAETVLLLECTCHGFNF